MPNESLLSIEEPGALRRFLFRDTLHQDTPRAVVAWWERRRLPFNLIVGGTGLVAITVVNVLSAIGPAAQPWGFPPLALIAVYGTLANVMFTGGWISELLTRRLLGRRSGTVGATLFRYGLVFSAGLTAMPIAAAALELAFRIGRWMFGGGP